MSHMYWVPCPKCGSKEDLGFACNSPRNKLWIHCLACPDVNGPMVPDSEAMDAPTEQDREDSENAAVDAWNEKYVNQSTQAAARPETPGTTSTTEATDGRIRN